MKLLQIALAPTAVCVIYIYIRDKYEKEPIYLLLTGLLYGLYITAPIIAAETVLAFHIPDGGLKTEAFYNSFLVSGFVEESFKFIILFFLVWRNDNFNERFDGIVYAVFISLGFAGVENVMYVFNKELGGMGTAVTRAVFSVPGHALFGVAMGYYFALSKFEKSRKVFLILCAFFVPWFLHGVYNFILLSGLTYFMFIFIPFVTFLWINGFKKMRRHLSQSPFKMTA